MKRREFIASSLGIAGLSLPLVGRTQPQPCAPDFIGVAQGTSTTQQCPDQVGGDAPGWFEKMLDRTWIAFDNGPKDITGQPTYGGLYARDSPVGNLFSYSGGCVHERNQSLLVHGGGHNAGADNGIYEFSLTDPNSHAGTPRWKTFKVRGAPAFPEGYASVAESEMWNPEYFFDRYYSSIDAAIHPQGSPRSSHIYGNWTYVPSQDGNPANDSVWILSTGGGQPPSINSPSWLRSDQNLWPYWRVQNNAWTMMNRDQRYGQYPGPYNQQFSAAGAATYNGLHPSIPPHIFLPKTGSSDRHVIVDVATGARRLLSECPRIASNAVGAHAPSVMMLGESIIAWCDISTQKLFLINPLDYTDPRNNVARTVSAPWPTGTWAGEHGLVWHSPSNGFLAWGQAKTATGVIWKLHQPERNWWNGTWQWTAVAPAGGDTPTEPENGTRTYRRFNIIRNVGGSGRDALVLINHGTGPTFVYKLPVNGLR